MLERKRDGTLGPDRLHVEGAVAAVADYQSSNRDDEFGWLMRHPTASWICPGSSRMVPGIVIWNVSGNAG